MFRQIQTPSKAVIRLLVGVFSTLLLVGWEEALDLSRMKDRRQDSIIDGHRIDAQRHESTGALVMSGGGEQYLFCFRHLDRPDVVLTAAMFGGHS